MTVFGNKELVGGFKLAGVDGIVVDPLTQGDIAIKLLNDEASKKDIAIIVLGQSLFNYLINDIKKIRETGPVPAIISLPELSDDIVHLTSGQMMEELLGVNV